MSVMETAKQSPGSAGMLTAQEREICGRIATGDAPHSQRALALMALDQGVTQAEAAELSGLTIGQVRYWRDRFLDKRVGVFPAVATAEAGGSAQSKAPGAPARRPEPSTSAAVGTSKGAGEERVQGGVESARKPKTKPKKKKLKDSTAKKKKKSKQGNGKKARKTQKKSPKKKKQKKKAKSTRKSGKKKKKKSKSK